MAFNGHTKFPKTTSQNYTNILYSDSDSDDIPDLKLPPVKGKKLKRRKDLSGKQNDPICNLWVVLKLISAVVIFLALTILTAACFWTVRQIRELQDQVDAYDNSNKATVEIMKLHTQLAEVNDSVMNVKTELSQTKKTLTDVQTKLEKLEIENTKLQKSTSTSNELPTRVQLLSESLAVIGKDMTQMKNTSFLLGVDFENRLRELELTVKDKSGSSDNTGDRQLVVALNQSLVSGIQNLRQTLDQQAIRVKVLEDSTLSYTNESKHDLDSAWVTDLVTKLLQDKMLSATSQPDNGKLLALGEDVFENMKEINETLKTLSVELDAVSSRLDGHDTALKNLTVAIVRGMKSSGVTHLETTPSVNSSSEEFTSEFTSSPSNSNVQEELSTEVNQTRPGFHIEGINSLEDLHNAFMNNWPVEKGRVDIDIINTLLPSMLDKVKLKQFDADGDGLYTEDELAEALGFHHNPR